MQNKELKSIAGDSQLETSILIRSFLDITHHYTHSYGKSSGHTSFTDSCPQILKAISGQSNNNLTWQAVNYISKHLWNRSYDSTHARCHRGILLIAFYQCFFQAWTKQFQIWIYPKLKWLHCGSAVNSTMTHFHQQYKIKQQLLWSQMIYFWSTIYSKPISKDSQ